MKTNLSLCGLRAALSDIEQENGIRILHVAECDSRAWGFSVDDSDYDLRFMYVKLPWKRTLLDTADTRRFKFKVEGLPVDTQGFELSHVLRKISQSAFNMHEMFHSPICLAKHHNFFPLFIAALQQYTRNYDVINFCRGLMRKNFEFVNPMTAKNMLHALRFALIAERLKEGKELMLDLPQLVGEATCFNELLPELLALRKERYFIMPEQVQIYLHRMTHHTDWPLAEKHENRDVNYFADLDLMYQYITKAVCEQYEGMNVDGLQWIDDDTSYYEQETHHGVQPETV